MFYSYVVYMYLLCYILLLWAPVKTVFTGQVSPNKLLNF